MLVFSSATGGAECESSLTGYNYNAPYLAVDGGCGEGGVTVEMKKSVKEEKASGWITVCVITDVLLITTISLMTPSISGKREEGKDRGKKRKIKKKK
ncbi:hypothetical protein Baya_13954 [Bagarius yarrelli]|uniref:Uncharacterized protein n=1 Tax=Bagarius yarrelli TaxID=175774 RepID=A0A556V7F3_BAGYA|nr:hypothetical protein Baya_13954 [Bagarius yarrelli]